MAVKGLAAWLRATHPGAFGPRTSAKFNAIHIEANTLMHTAVRSALPNQQSAVHGRMHSALAGLLRRTLRTEGAPHVHVAFDGVAHVAKVAEQRARRARSAAEAERRGSFCAAQATPGCLFVRAAETTAVAACAKAAPQATVVVSGASVAGEGEAKVFASLRSTADSHLAVYRDGFRAAVVGSDSDLLLLALAHQARMPGVDLCVVAPPWDMQLPGTAAFSARALLASVLATANTLDRKLADVVDDLVVATALAGNDYAPAVPWSTYRQTWPLVLAGRLGAPLLLPSGHVCARAIATLARLLIAEQHVPDDRPRNPDAVAPYLARVDWSVRQSLGTSDAPDAASVPDETVPDRFNGCAPTVHDLAAMDADHMQHEMLRLSARYAALPAMLPGTGAIVLLEQVDSATALPFLPGPLRPIASAHWARRSRDASDSLTALASDVCRVNAAVSTLRRHAMSYHDAACILPSQPMVRGPITHAQRL